ncbi:sorbosone dehydrogenase family protein [Rhabdobacter roseus]|uniref:Glucose/arabinose dehydrogenase n=1 Tax=Rhabdobacter roseus TaxID=1655419 RepID=A0A840TJW6_9BACT|nr:PQQ-dependent sugar dehydrogenase [Rhabdobacter roseus]MBB5283714.1 glucose/arabinose dehydrogenase [Rhabdobacter roseus]
MQKRIRAYYGIAALAGLSTLLAFHQSTDDDRKAAEAAAIKVPTGFTTTVVAEGLAGARHLAVTPNGDLYVKLAKLKDGKGIVRLRDTNGDGQPDEQLAFGNYEGTGIYLRDGYLYTSSNSEVFRYKLNEKGEISTPDQPERIVHGLVLRDRDKSKSIALDQQGYLYVNVGSYSDACREAGTGKGIMPCPLLDSTAAIWRFRADRPNQTYADGLRYAKGLKNTVGLDWNTKTNSLFVMNHGRGQFHDFYPQYYTPQQSAQLPSEVMYELHEGADAGWPYVYYDHLQKKKILAPEYGGDGKKTGGKGTLDPVAAFPAHFGPNGLLFYTGRMFPKKYQDGAFIAFHGQNTEMKKGYFVAFVPFKNGKPSGKWEVFADNFAGIDLANPSGPVQHRPCGLAQGTDGALYVSDDLNGTVYRIAYGVK